MDGFQSHFGNIRHTRLKTDMGKHFNTEGHHGLQDVEVHIVDFIHLHPHSKGAEVLRNKIENNWMYRLRTVIPAGLNLIDAPIYQSTSGTQKKVTQRKPQVGTPALPIGNTSKRGRPRGKST